MEEHKDIIIEALNDYRKFWSDRRWKNDPGDIWENKVRVIEEAIEFMEGI
jgi:hypothetical protein